MPISVAPQCKSPRMTNTTILQVFPKLALRGSSNCVTPKTNQSLSLPVTIPKNTKLVCQYDETDSDLPHILVKEVRRKPKRKVFRHKVSKRTISLMSARRTKEDTAVVKLRLPKIFQWSRNKSSKKSGRLCTPPPSPKMSESASNIDLGPLNGIYYVENEFTRFSPPSKYPRISDKKNLGVSIIRSQRLFHLTKQLRKCHEEYNKLHGLEERDRFLSNEILQRYIMALDLALTENCKGIALEVAHSIYDATKCMIPLYSNVFYAIDGTHARLPMVVPGGSNYIKALAPVIYALNRIPHSSSTHDNSQLRLETHLMKLQLEILMLVVAPVESMIFRATLEVVPKTAWTAYQRLASLQPPGSLQWANNSVMKKEYAGILEKFGLADQLGCKGSLTTINSSSAPPTKSSRKVNCDSELEMSDEEEDGE